MPSTYFAGLDLPLTPKDAVSPYRREDHGPEIRTIKKLMIVQFAGAVLADVLLRYGTGNGQLASVMFALVFGHMAARIAPRRVALRRKLAILRMKADQLSMDPYVPPDMLEQAVDQVRARLNRLASVDLIVVPFTAAFLGLSQLLVGIDVLPRTFASWPHFSIPAVIAFAAFHEWRFRSYMNSLFPLPARAQAGE